MSQRMLWSSEVSLSSLVRDSLFRAARVFAPAVLPALAFISFAPAWAQYPGQIKKQDDKAAPELRAVGVVEYTGEAGHPKASRLIPISLYDGHELQDAGVYLARPYPLALEGEVEYQIQLDGKAVGYFDVRGAGQQQGSWIGEGVWKPLVTPRSASQVARANVKIKLDDDEDAATDGPVLHRKAHDDDSGNGGSSGPPPDPDRPTLHKGGDASGSGSSGAGSSSGGASSGGSSGQASDPDRPTLHRSASADDTASGNTAPADPDRPRLQKKPAQQAASNTDEASVSSLPDVSDPNRPRLRRGIPADIGVTVAPTVMGLPPEMEQQVAVSDSKTIADHPWNFSWANLDDEAKMKSSLEDEARKALGLVPPPAPAKAASASKTTAAKTTGSTTASKTATAKTSAKAAVPPAPPEPAPLVDEQFHVFELAYGSGATMVLSAHTDGSGAQQKFVTLIAQPNLYGNVIVLFKNVTDAIHLDDTPRMRLIDAVDAMADNRGELLFELRGATQRQFALYRVLRGSVDKVFATGSTYFGSPTGE